VRLQHGVEILGRTHKHELVVTVAHNRLARRAASSASASSSAPSTAPAPAAAAAAAAAGRRRRVALVVELERVEKVHGRRARGGHKLDANANLELAPPRLRHRERRRRERAHVLLEAGVQRERDLKWMDGWRSKEDE
jgi:hypothetical protein